MNVYECNGYKDREDYLSSLAERYDTDIETVRMIADMLGESEDFDGLIITLEDEMKSMINPENIWDL